MILLHVSWMKRTIVPQYNSRALLIPKEHHSFGRIIENYISFPLSHSSSTLSSRPPSQKPLLDASVSSFRECVPTANPLSHSEPTYFLLVQGVSEVDEYCPKRCHQQRKPLAGICDYFISRGYFPRTTRIRYRKKFPRRSYRNRQLLWRMHHLISKLSDHVLYQRDTLVPCWKTGSETGFPGDDVCRDAETGLKTFHSLGSDRKPAERAV